MCAQVGRGLKQRGTVMVQDTEIEGSITTREHSPPKSGKIALKSTEKIFIILPSPSSD